MPDWKKNAKIFLLGALWAALSGAAPAGVMIWDWVQNWNNPVDWTEVAHIGITGAAIGVAMYYRKHKALITLPPGLQEAMDMQQSAVQQDQKKT